MSFDPDIMKQLLSVFSAEMEEHLAVFDRVLIALEKGVEEPEWVPLVDEIMRSAHSLKGASRAVGLPDIERLAHSMEDMLSELGQTKGDKIRDFQALYAAADAIRDAWEEQSAGIAAPAAPDVTQPPPEASAVAAEPEQTPAVSATGTPATPPEDAVRDAATQRNGADRRAGLEDRRTTFRRFEDATAVRETVRVDTSRLDAIMAQVQEMLVMRIRGEQRLGELREIRERLDHLERDERELLGTLSRLVRTTRDSEMTSLQQVLLSLRERTSTIGRALDVLTQELAGDGLRTALITGELQEGVRQARMLPVGTLFDGFHRMVRDVARERGKEIDFVTAGVTIELDKQILEVLKDPLTHLLRNAIDHGIETPEARRELGKAECGRITLSAFQRGNMILIELRDDGAGIDCDVLRARAVEKGMLAKEEARKATDAEVMLLIFHPGFSTSPVVTDLSGRGIGLNVVRENVGQLGGVLDVESVVKQGTTFKITVPLTVSTFRGLLIEVAQQQFAIPLSSVVRALRIEPSSIQGVGGRPVLKVDGRPVPVVELAGVLELPGRHVALEADDQVCVIVLGMAERRVAVIVDSVIKEEEIIVKSLGRQLARVRNVSAGSIMGDGRVVIILNVPDIIRNTERLSVTGVLSARARHAADTGPRRILVVDDSITTRTLEKNILETAGYDVVVATNAAAAMCVLETQTIHLVVTDVQMPGESGFELTERVRRSEKLAHMPVVLVTFLESDSDRGRGIEVGADAYIPKRSFSQETLLETVRQLV